MIRVDENTVAVHINGARELYRLPILSEHDAAARHLVKLYDERVALANGFAKHPQPTGAMAVEVMDKGRELDAACEDFRRRFYRRKHRVVSAGGSVFAVSRTARSITTLYDAGVAR